MYGCAQCLRTEVKCVTFLEGLARFIAGGLMVLSVSIIGRSGNSKLAGVALLFPAITTVGYFFLANNAGVEQLKKSIIGSLVALPLSAVFLLILYYCIPKFSMVVCIILGIIGWLIWAIILMI